MDRHDCVFVGEKVREYIGRWVAEMDVHWTRGKGQECKSCLGEC